MRILLSTFLALLSVQSFAQSTESKHQVIFGNDFGSHWSASASTADVDSDLGIDDYNMGMGNLSINYAYRVAPQFQIGLILGSETSKSETKYKSSVGGGKITNEDSSVGISAFVTFNFIEDLANSFYVAGLIGKQKLESEEKDTSAGGSGKTESDSDFSVWGLAFGKRFSLKGMGIENLTYSPSISYQHASVGGDLEDTGINSVSVLSLDIIKFDLLF